MRPLLAALAFGLIAGCVHVEVSTPQTVAQAQAVTFAELDAANAAFSAAWVAGDVEALLDAYTEDAIVHPPAGGVLTTREQIRGAWAPIINQQRVGHRLEPTLRRVLGDNRVLEMGRWHTSRTNEAGESPWVSGCYTLIWRREEGAWRMEYDGWTGVNDASWACRPR